MIVYLAIDFFFENWNSADQRMLWIAVLPYVKDEDSLAEWVETGCMDGANIEYRLLSGVGNDTYENFIPVTLPADTNLKISLLDDEGSAIVTEQLQRTSQFIITNPELFRKLNESTGITADDYLVEEGSAPLQHAQKDMPYAVSLVHALQDMWSEAPSDLPLWLQLAFEIGQRRRFSADCMLSIGPYISVPHPDENELHEFEVTNLHCLAGLMVPLGNDVPLLNEVVGARIQFEVSGGIADTVDLHKGNNQKKALARFFETIRTTFTEPGTELKWLPEIAKRAYAFPAGQMFKREYLGGISDVILFRRPRDSEEAEQPHVDIAYQSLDRLVVRYNMEGSDKHPENPQTLNFKPISTFDLQGDPYRSFPVELMDGSSSQTVIIEITAQPHDIKRWQALTSELYTSRSGVPQIQNKLRLFMVSDDGDFEPVQANWVALFKFPWEQGDAPTVLMCLPTNQSGRYVALFEVDGRRSMTLQLKGLDIYADPFGPRWEFRPSSASEFQFDSLELTSELEGLSANDLVVSAYSSDDYHFELAQSARRIEGVARVGIAEVPHFSDPDDVDAAIEFAEDYINHNTANFVEDWGESRKLLNSTSESTPDFWEMQSGKHWYTFHFRFMSPTSARPGMSSVRKFYSNLYGRLGAERSIHIDLEHTYGTRLEFDSNHYQNQPTYLDEPILHPANISEQLTEVERVDFIWVRYYQSAGSEIVELNFDRRLLSSAWIAAQSESLHQQLTESHIEAWQSVAELVSAKRILLVGEAYRFDFHSALEHDISSVGNGLVFSQAPITFDITTEMKNELSGWLNGDADVPTTGWKIKRPYTDGVLWKTSNVLRFCLSIERSEGLYPAVHNDWVIVTKPTSVPQGNPTNLVDTNGSVVVPLFDQVSKGLLDGWMASLRETSSYLDAEIDSSIERDRIERYRGLLGSGPNLGSALTESNAWIIPDGALDSSMRANMVILPLGFRPVQKDEYLGDSTNAQVRAYFSLLQSAIDLKSEYWAKSFDANKWLTLLRSWDSKSGNGAEIDTAYAHLCRHAAKTIFPVPRTDEDNALHAVVKSTALAVKSATPISDAVFSELQLRIGSQPETFAKNKAFVYTRLAGPGLSQVAPPEFYSVKVQRMIASSEGLEDVPVISHDFSEVYSNGLRAVANTPWFGFLEGLDDNVYDNDFKVLSVDLTSMENVLEETLPSISLEDDVIYVPDETPQKMSDISSATEIGLPSRKLVQKPVSVATGMFEISQSLSEFELAFPLHGRKDFGAFLEGRSQEPQDGLQAIQRVASFATTRTKQIDDIMVSCILSVRGDEEFETDWLNGLANDAFFILIDDDPDQSQKDQIPPAPSESVRASFELIDSEDAEERDLRDVLSTDTLRYVGRILGDVESGAVEPKNFVTKFAIEDDERGSPVVKFLENFASHAVEVHFFQGADANDEDQIFVWLNIELGVWRPRFVRLSQSRNFPSINRQFTEEFGMLSIEESSGFFPRKSIVRSLRDRDSVGVSVDEPISVRRFLNMALISSGILKELGEVDGVQQFVVNVTLNDIIEPSYPTMGPAIDEMTTDEIGVFPVENIRVEQAADWDITVFDWFPNANEIRIDVEWRRRDTNDILFRVEGLRVQNVT